jgi:curved DNA-binding protein CbpA
VIEAAYRRLARKYHPDVSQSPNAEARMRELNAAYEVLRDPTRRADYDQTRAWPSSEAGSSWEGTPVQRQDEERFAEWYVWAKREVATDNRVCLGATQAAIETLDAGGDTKAARTAARRSVAGQTAILLDRVAPRLRAYAEWYDWARHEVDGDRRLWHRATRAALHCLDGGGNAEDCADTARQAAER